MPPRSLQAAGTRRAPRAPMPARSWRLTKAGLVNRNAWRMVLAHLRRAKLYRAMRCMKSTGRASSGAMCPCGEGSGGSRGLALGPSHFFENGDWGSPVRRASRGRSFRPKISYSSSCRPGYSFRQPEASPPLRHESVMRARRPCVICLTAP